MSDPDNALLTGSSLLSFARNIEPDLRQDIIDCLHHAKLVADDRHSSRGNWRAWLDVYQRSIAATGGSHGAGINDARLKIHSFSDIGSLQLPVFDNAGELRQLYRSSLDRLLSSDHAKTFFSSWFTSGRSESFQLIPCSMHSEDEVTILLCSLQMTTIALRPALYFWQVLGGEMQVHVVGTAFRFSRQSFEPFRQVVQDTLADRAAAEIISL
ncbi:hypothetical protein [Pseudomonas fragariae (ex Marin et al. 2024)]|uniref:Uncharacterized protein n=2 Tax=Pseudomonas fragariae (ex Marin et al. 2024) TaxID=3080056 RepID=A0ABU5B4L7_9PSED|nr:MULTISPECIES: hypothetical protein [unclassified Pseudomonas]MCW6056375.1 hypothetical protein [Pseudomonas fragi]MDV0426454.1 hypothetical protein [Pseudomonas sp. 17]MDX9572583.1 hypothetical protein [Pseudomonas sp. 21(2023)]MDX9586495.1 hypothetical protein [Pseudomonas sp. 19(2023)]MDX9624002.1 hypothetical protein [Pseudomonas sp. 20]